MARALARSVPWGSRVLLIDPSDSELLDDPDVVTFRDPTRWPDVWRARFVPSDPDDREAYDTLFDEVLRRCWTWVLVDEAGFVLPANPHRGSKARKAIVQGRKRSVGLAACHTRPVEVDRHAISDAEHLFLFRLDGADAELVAKAASVPNVAATCAAIAGLPEHGFVYVDKRAGTEVTFPGL